MIQSARHDVMSPLCDLDTVSKVRCKSVGLCMRVEGGVYLQHRLIHVL